MKELPILFSGPMVRAILEDRKFQTRRLIKPQPDELREYGGHLPEGHVFCPIGDSDAGLGMRDPLLLKCPYGKPGDRLWVRETWRVGAWRNPESSSFDGFIDRGDWYAPGRFALDYRASPDLIRTPWVTPERLQFLKIGNQCVKDCEKAKEENGFKKKSIGIYKWDRGFSPCRWRPSIHMPRWASRILLEITKVRVERVQHISHQDSIAEGIDVVQGYAPRIKPTTIGQLAFSYLWNSIYAKRGFGWSVNPWVWVLEFKRGTE